MHIPLSATGLRQVDINSAIRVLKSGKLTIGKEVSSFEKAISQYLRVKHFVMVNSGSSANLAIFEALMRPTLNRPKLIPGDGVLVPAIAWPTTIWPIIQLGLEPYFVDVNLENLALDLNQAQKIIDMKSTKIKALFPIHPLGFGINHIELNNFSRKNKLILLNDVCESLGSWYGKVHAGTSGLAASFSFYFSHHLTTMEGGGIATNSDDFADDLRSIRSHGWSRDRFDKRKIEMPYKKDLRKYLFVTTGFNIRPMEIQGAIGISQLKNLNDFVIRRRTIVHKVADALSGRKIQVIGEKYVFNEQLEPNHSWMLLPLRITVRNKNLRSKIIETLESMGIENRPVLTGNFLRQPALLRFKNYSKPSNFPNSNLVEETSFLVSCHHDLSDRQVNYLIRSLLKVEKLI